MPVFRKTAPAAELCRFEAEAAGLAALRATGSVRVPVVIAVGITNGLARIDLEHLDLAGLDRSSGATLGRQLAELHRHAGDRFGWQGDNWIGDTPQQNGWQPEWPLFFRPQSVATAAAQGRRQRHGAQAGRTGQLAGRTGAFLWTTIRHHRCYMATCGAATPPRCPMARVIFDPAAYYGDREADLAMSELFGGFPESFYAAYRLAWPLDAGYETRKTLYNLYHVLNHYNLFGAGYLNQVRRMIDRLAAELRG
jgi:fructosamine-3-kinase